MADFERWWACFCKISVDAFQSEDLDRLAGDVGNTEKGGFIGYDAKKGVEEERSCFEREETETVNTFSSSSSCARNRGGESMAMTAAEQRVVVMRHGDRLDHAEPMWPANKPRPWDPPLTDAGILRAWNVGKRIRAQAAADGFRLHRVLVSPFFRCLQTAAQAVAALCAVPDDAALVTVDSSANVPLDTSRVKVSIEYALSEMMNVEAMGSIVGQVAPTVDKWFPDLSELEAVLPPGTIDHSVEPLYPEVPRWGESVREARIRYGSVIKALADKYPNENLLLVTHGEGVGSSVACFGAGLEIYEVEYCAYSMLERRRQQMEGDEGESSLLKLLTDRSGPTTGIRYLVT